MAGIWFRLLAEPQRWKAAVALGSSRVSSARSRSPRSPHRRVAESVVPWAVVLVGIPALRSSRTPSRSFRVASRVASVPPPRCGASDARNPLHWTHDAKGVTMTRIDTPLELTSLRDDPPSSRYRPSGSALPTRVAAVLAMAAAALAAGDANSASVGPGRFVLLVVVIAWCLGALVTSVLRPSEPLAGLMTLAGGTIALAMLGAAEAANHPTYDATAVVRADRDRRTPRRRDAPRARTPRRPARRPGPSPVGARRRRPRGRGRRLVHRGAARAPGRRARRARRAVAAAVALIGYVRALPPGAHPGRARPAAVAGVGRADRGRDRARRGRAQRARRLAERARSRWRSPPRSLIPFALALGAHRSLAVRIDRLLVHTITFAGLVGLVGAS